MNNSATSSSSSSQQPKQQQSAAVASSSSSNNNNNKNNNNNNGSSTTTADDAKRKLEYQSSVNKMERLRTVNNKSTGQLSDQLNCVQRVITNLSKDDSSPLLDEKQRKQLVSSRSVQSMRSYFKP